MDADFSSFSMVYLSLVVSLEIFSVATHRTMCPGVDSASKNEYQGFLLG
jgi:hypothetical protein